MHDPTTNGNINKNLRYLIPYESLQSLSVALTQFLVLRGLFSGNIWSHSGFMLWLRMINWFNVRIFGIQLLRWVDFEYFYRGRKILYICRFHSKLHIFYSKDDHSMFGVNRIDALYNAHTTGILIIWYHLSLFRLEEYAGIHGLRFSSRFLQSEHFKGLWALSPWTV